MIKNFSLRILFTILGFLCVSLYANADFLTPTSVTSLNSSPWPQYNNVNALIENATNINYIAPNPSSGGGGTSTYTNQNSNTWTFNLDTAHTLNMAYIWDYYGHSPTRWRLTFFDGTDASGNNLGSHTFNIAPVCRVSCSTRHDISFADVANVRSITLTSMNRSSRGGVGLAEVHFGDTASSGNDKLNVSVQSIIQGYGVSPYGGSQDYSGTVEIRDAGSSLYLDGNRWQKIDLPYTVTTDTVIEFDFQSTNRGEIHGIGFDNNLAISANRSFRVYGSQNWGIRDFATYSGSGVTHYVIPVGQYYTGNFQYLFFINDDDSNPTGNSLYSNVVVHEGITKDCTTDTNNHALIFCEGFETPDIAPPYSQNLPSGWTETGDSGLIDEGSGWLTTPYGNQVLWINNGSVATSNSNLSEVLIGEATYTLNFNVAKRNDLDGNYKVELLAGSTVLATATGTATRTDFSESDELVFVSSANHANLGETLQIQLSTNGTLQAQFDNISLTATGDGRLSVSKEGIGQRYTVSSYGGSGQDRTGTAEVRDIDASLFLEGNRWKKIDFPYTITPDTVIEFDFESTNQGEIHGLGFDNNIALSANRSFKLYGTQNWGLRDYATYSGSGVTHYSIPVGQYYTGNFQYLFFMNDDDSNPTGNSLYSNINVHEGSTNGQLSGNLNVDNTFEAYLSTDDSVQGTLIASGASWTTTYNLATSLAAEQDYYLHIKATDTGGPAGFLGDFTIAGSDHTFENGLTTLNTNPTDWRVSTSGWSNYQSATSYGINGSAPWGARAGASVNANAQWIWSSNNNSDNLNYFTTKITATPSSCASAGTLDAVGIKINRSGRNTRINNTTEALAIHRAWLAAGSPATGLISGGTYNVSASGSSTVDRIDFGGSIHDYDGSLPYPGVSAGVGGSDFLVYTSGTVSLAAGDYTIYVESDDGFSFVMNTISGDAVSFNKFGNSRSGASNELRYERPTGNSNTGGSFTLTQDSVFDVAAIFFERGGGDYLEISIADNIRTNAAPSGYEVLRHGALGDKVQFGCVAIPKVNHYQIIHDGNGLTCAPETVTIKACTNAYDGTCTLSNEVITLDVKATGSSSVVDSISFQGTGTASISYTTPETVVLSLENTSIAATNSPVCSDGSGSSCNIIFDDAGFRFLNGNSGDSEIITNQIAGTSFPIRLQAVKNSNGVCTGLFTGNKSIDISQENIAPGGISGLNFTIAGNNINKHSSVTPTTLNFGADSTVTIPTPIYHDAGKIRLHANYDVGGVTLYGATNAFWVRPDKLVITAKYGTTPLNGTTANAPTKHIAGENFDLTVSALNSNDVPTPNYSPGQIQFKLKRTGPTVNGVEGTLTYAAPSSIPLTLLTSLNPNTFENVTLNSFTSGLSSYAGAQYSEVGLISLDLQDNNYGNFSDNNIVISADEINIGRFIPAAFKFIEKVDGALHVTPSGPNFAYVGQKNGSDGAIKYEVQPQFTIQAVNASGDPTKNYTSNDEADPTKDFMKLTTAQVVLVQPTTDDADGLDGIDADGTIGTIGALGAGNPIEITAEVSGELLGDNAEDGKLTLTLATTDHFTYKHTANAQITPFMADIDIIITSIIDSDGVSLPDQNDTIAYETPGVLNFNPTGVPIRFGRWYIDNAYGPETEDLPAQMYTQYWDGTSFVINTLDNYTIPNLHGAEPKKETGLIRSGGLAAWQYRLLDLSTEDTDDERITPNDTTVTISDPLTFDKGKYQDFIFSAPTNGYRGSLIFEYEVPVWLKYNWDNGTEYDDNPSAKVTFGLFRGNDRIISWREVSN